MGAAIWSAGPTGGRAEAYLRMLAESQLRQALGSQPPVSGHVRASLDRIGTLAAALVSVCALDEPTARSVVQQFHTALAVRGLIDEHQFLRPMVSRPEGAAVAPAPPPGPRLTVPLGASREVEADGQPGRIYLGGLVVEPDLATFSFSAWLPPETPVWDPVEYLGSWTVTDDLGGCYRPGFSGGGGTGGHWSGSYEIRPAPPAAAGWLEIAPPGGTPVRVDLRATSAAPATRAIRLTPGEVAERYVDALAVRLLLAGASEPAQASGRRLVLLGADLLAAGTLAPASQAITRLAAAAVRLGMDLPEPLTEISPGSVPDQWLRMAARTRSQDGPTGVIGVAAELPELDGARCVITGLEAQAGSAVISVQARGWPTTNAFGRWAQAEPLAWSARDDQGGWYLMRNQGFSSGGGDHASLRMELIPALNPLATELEIILTGRTGEVGVTVPLRWLAAS